MSVSVNSMPNIACFLLGFEHNLSWIGAYIQNEWWIIQLRQKIAFQQVIQSIISTTHTHTHTRSVGNVHITQSAFTFISLWFVSIESDKEWKDNYEWYRRNVRPTRIRKNTEFLHISLHLAHLFFPLDAFEEKPLLNLTNTKVNAIQIQPNCDRSKINKLMNAKPANSQCFKPLSCCKCWTSKKLDKITNHSC